MFDFPNAPSDGERVTHPNGNIYEFNNIKQSWLIVRDDLAALHARIALLESQSQSLFLLE